MSCVFVDPRIFQSGEVMDFPKRVKKAAGRDVPLLMLCHRLLMSTINESDRAGYLSALTYPMKVRDLWRATAAALGKVDIKIKAVSTAATFRMPEMDGFKLTREIREAETEGVRLPIIALTADALPGTEEACLEVGMDGYLTKPINTERLQSVLREWLPQADPLRLIPAEEATASEAPGVQASSPAEPSPAALSPLDDPEILDHEQLAEIFGEVDEDALNFADEFATEAVEIIDRFKTALDAGDHAEARHKIHALKGAAKKVGDMASDLQDMCDAGQHSKAAELAAPLAEAQKNFASFIRDRM